jgi:molybdopterin-guanine dinucleotide biosynthesis protein A
MRVVGAVMAGGLSTRFGRDKALLEIGGETLLRRTVRVLKEVTGEVLVLGPPERAKQVSGVTVVQDSKPGTGPLGGIATALATRRGDAVLAVAVDMPFLNATLLGYLVRLAEDADVVLPVAEGRGQQLHAVFGPASLPHIEEQMLRGDFKIDRFFPLVRVRRVEEDELLALDPGLRSFRNVNTTEAWKEILREAGG